MKKLSRKEVAARNAANKAYRAEYEAKCSFYVGQAERSEDSYNDDRAWKVELEYGQGKLNAYMGEVYGPTKMVAMVRARAAVKAMNATL